MTTLDPIKPQLWFIFQQDQPLLLSHGTNVSPLTYHQIEHVRTHLQCEQELGEIDGSVFFCAELSPSFSPSSEWCFIPLKSALALLNPDLYGMAIKAYSIINWDKHHRFCGRCANPTRHIPGTFERECAHCAHIFYPRISPSIIVLIQQGDKLLMARSPHFPPSVFGLIAGFVEPGENLEQAVHREVQEEVGIRIKNLNYHCSQAWPFPDSIMMGFTAEYAEGDILINPGEIEAAGWYHFDNLPGRPSSSISISSKLIDHFIDLKKKVHLD